MPICFKDKYLLRFLDFKKYGFLNTKNYKIKLTLLIDENENFSKIEEGWDELNFNIEKVFCNESDAPSKIHWYYVNKLEEDLDCRWWIKIDDDTANDVGNIIKKLDEEFDYKKDLYIGANIHTVNGKFEERVIKKLNLKKIDYAHEWEACVLSNSLITKIVHDEKSKKILKERLKEKGGFGDRILAFPTILLKIHPISSYFISYECPLIEFSKYGGEYYHIHFQTNFCNEMKYLLYKKTFNKVEKEISIIWKNEIHRNEKKLLFKKNNTIEFEEKIFGIWAEENDYFYINRKDMPNKVFKFSKNTGKELSEGKDQLT